MPNKEEIMSAIESSLNELERLVGRADPDCPEVQYHLTLTGRLREEFTALQRDQERLEWLLKKGVLQEGNGFVIIDRRSDDPEDWAIILDREAIDAAMEADK